MNIKQEASKIIKELETGGLYLECPCCGEPIRARDAGLFYLDDFTEDAEQRYREWQQELREKEKALQDKRKKISERSEKGAKATNIGFILERMVPVMKEFTFERTDCRALFDPIDYIIFEGLTKKGVVTKLFFIDIKTGKARLTGRQSEIRDLVEEKKIQMEIYKQPETIRAKENYKILGAGY